MLDGKKQKHRDHREASVARSVLISATERLSEPQGGEFSRMVDNRCTDQVGNAVGHGFWLFADSILIKCSVFQLLTPARKPPTTSYFFLRNRFFRWHPCFSWIFLRCASLLLHNHKRSLHITSQQMEFLHFSNLSAQHINCFLAL